MIKNITDLRTDLLQSYEQIKSGEMKVDQAKEVANIAGKVLKSCKLQLDYYRQMDYKNKIDFLEP